jgi:hypothetical protein
MGVYISCYLDNIEMLFKIVDAIISRKNYLLHYCLHSGNYSQRNISQKKIFILMIYIYYLIGKVKKCVEMYIFIKKHYTTYTILLLHSLHFLLQGKECRKCSKKLNAPHMVSPVSLGTSPYII